MTETKEPMTGEEKKEPISIETRKVIQGISLVFSGAVTMLEALHPHVSLEPSALLHLITGNVEGLEAMAAEKRAKEAGKENKDHETEAADTGSVDAPAADPSGAASVDDDAPEVANPQTGAPPKTVTTLTQDDITRVIVQKLRQNRSNNEKIGQLLKAHGVAKVSELPADRYEAFLTDLSAI